MSHARCERSLTQTAQLLSIVKYDVWPWVQTGGVPLQVLLGRQVLWEAPLSSNGWKHRYCRAMSTSFGPYTKKWSPCSGLGGRVHTLSTGTEDRRWKAGFFRVSVWMEMKYAASPTFMAFPDPKLFFRRHEKKLIFPSYHTVEQPHSRCHRWGRWQSETLATQSRGRNGKWHVHPSGETDPP